MLLLLMLSTANAAPADCPSPTTVATLQAQVDAAEADAESTAENLGGLVAEALASVPCLVEPVPSSLAAKLHRMVGLEQARVDEFKALPAFSAARAIEPDTPLTPSGNLGSTTIGKAYDTVDPTRITWTELPAAADGTLRSDGQTPARRSEQLPVLLQLESGSDVLWSHYVAPGAPLPGYTVAAAASVPPPEPVADGDANAPLPPAPTPTRAKAALRWSGLGTAVVGGALYGLGAMELQEFNAQPDGSLTDPQAKGYQRRVNSLSVGGVAGMVMGGALFAVSFKAGG